MGTPEITTPEVLISRLERVRELAFADQWDEAMRALALAREQMSARNRGFKYPNRLTDLLRRIPDGFLGIDKYYLNGMIDGLLELIERCYRADDDSEESSGDESCDDTLPVPVRPRISPTNT